MAASAAPTNTINASATTSPAPLPGTLPAASNRTETPPPPPKSQRGHNKPKCKQCGNVARSRCPYESCKSCCSRNQNPCHIHVLKSNSNFPDKTPSSGAAPLDHQSIEPPQSTSAGRVASLRQLSNSFAQFNNLHLSLRSRKPLSRKDAATINEWRFSKLKEYKERSVEVENEAFDRYMQNVDLLEEVLSVKSLDDNVPSALESIPTQVDNEILVPGLKLQLRSNSMRSDRLRMRIQQIVDEGLKKLQKCVIDGEINEHIDEEANKPSKRGKKTEKLSAISDLIDKINKARSEEDLKSCLEMKFQLFNSDEGSDTIELQDNDEMHSHQTAESDAAAAKELDYSLPRLVGTAEIDEETLITIDRHFSSLEHVEKL